MQFIPNAQPDPSPGALPDAEALLATLPWGVLVLDASRRVRRVNEQAARWAEAPPAALLGRPLAEAGLPPALAAALLRVLEAHDTTPHEVFLPHAQQWICLTTTRQPDGGWTLYGQDISRQKRREQQYQALAENTPDLLTRWGPDLRLRYANAAFAAQAGQPLAALLGRTFGELGLPAAAADSYQAVLQRVFDTGQPQEDYHAFPGPTSIGQYHWRLVPELRDGQIETVLGIARDITELKHNEAENLRLHHALAQQATDKYQALLYSMDQGFCVVELTFDESGQRAVDFRYLELNPAGAQQTGLSADLLGRSIREVLPGLEPFWLDTYGRVARTGEPARFEHHVPPLGRWFDVHAFRMGGLGSRQVAVLFTDVTTRKLDEARQTFRLALRDALSAADQPEQVQQAVTHAAMHYFGADRCYYCEIEDGQAIIRRDAAREGLPSVAGTYPLASFPLLQAVIDAGRPFAVEDVRTDAAVDEELRQLCVGLHVIAYLNVPVLRAGQVRGVLCLVQSVPRTWTSAETELTQETAERAAAAVVRAHAEQALRRSEARLQLMLQSMSDAVYVGTAHGITLANAAALEQLGYQRHEELNRHIATLAQELHTRDYATGQLISAENQVFARALRGEPAGQEVAVTHRQTGTTRILRSVASPLVENGHVVAAVAINTDITQLKQYERRQAFLLQLADALRPLTNPDGVQQAACDALAAHLGAARVNYAEVTGDDYHVAHEYCAPGLASMRGRYPISSFRPAEREAFSAGRTMALADILTEPGLTATEAAAYGALGVRAFVSVPLVKNGRLLAVLSVIRTQPGAWQEDEVLAITETAERTWAAVAQARVEEALRDSEERLRQAITSAPMIWWEMDVASGLSTASDNYAAVFGIPAEERPAGALAAINQLVVAEDAPLLAAALAKAGQGEGDFWVEFRMRHPQSGHIIWAQASGRLLPGPPTGAGRIVGICQNITARKQHEQQQQFLLQLSDALRPLSDPVAVQETAARLLGEHLGVDRAYYARLDWERRVAIIERDFFRGDAPSIVGEHRLADFAGAAPTYRTGVLALSDVEDPHASPSADLPAYRALAARAVLSVPLLKGAVRVASLTLLHTTPRPWTAQEIALVEETAERTWAAAERARTEDTLRQSEARLRALVANLPGAAAFIVGPDLRYQLAGGEALDGVDFGPADLLGRTVAEAMPPEIVPQYEGHYRQVLAGQPFAVEHANHGHVYLSRGVPLLGPDGQPEAALVVSFDITERKRAEEALRASEAQLTDFNRQLEERVAERTQELRQHVGLLEQSEAVAQLGSWVVELATGELRWSAGMYRLFGLADGTPITPAIYFDYVLAEDRPVAERVVHALTTAPASCAETLRIQVGEEVKVLRIRAVVLYDEQGAPAQVLGIDFDVTETQRLAAENVHLRLTQQQQRIEAVLDAQEEERRRISESLHNGLGQLLYATKLQLDRLPPDAQQPAHHEAARLLGDAIRQTRAISHELTPALLEDFGLAAALQSICRNLSSPHLRWHCYVVLDEAPTLPRPLQIAVYRLAQELAQNVVKHAQATQATLEVEALPGWVVLRVEDDGRGFDPATATAGIGLRTLRNRVDLLGGTLHLSAEAAHGTHIQLRLPIPPLRA